MLPSIDGEGATSSLPQPAQLQCQSFPLEAGTAEQLQFVGGHSRSESPGGTGSCHVLLACRVETEAHTGEQAEAEATLIMEVGLCWMHIRNHGA